ncbi:hypothetical protein [Devosia submarina]|uniref:hypothetical protein n=1 Tax=Devosia submarina TaxID=1173082 RepID=UPI0013007A03|nr:hypothetical protein [Devosia submarina]
MTTSYHFNWPIIRAGIASLGMALCLPIIPTSAQTGLEQRESHHAAAVFAEKVEALIADLPVERERFDVRINRCQGARGEMRGDIYAVWVGVRLSAGKGDAAGVLTNVVADWRQRGWEIFRDRVLDNGGVNIAAVDPASGESHSLDSGFKRDPHRYIVGYFSTPCLQDPSGAAPFGSVQLEQ